MEPSDFSPPMPKVRVRTTEKASWSSNSLEKAVMLVEGGSSLRNGAKENSKIDVLKFHVESRIRHRYGRTVVTSVVANNADKAQEVSFRITLPETAFISAFQMEIDGKEYKAHVKEKEEAKQVYLDAVSMGLSAAHVEQNVRDSSKFTVSVNVEKTKTVTFKLTYEELLKRELSLYKHVINIDPGQIVPELLVEVHIEESCNLSLLEVPPLQETSELQLKPSTEANAFAKIERPKPNQGIVRWSLSSEDQKKLGANGVRGQLLVRYDVDRKTNPEQILINNGYFVHFYAPSDLPVLRKHVVFVLDVSGSMQGRKIEQMKDAMKTILSDLGSDDFFTLIIFSTDVRVWDPNVIEPLLQAETSVFGPRGPRVLTETAVTEAVVVPATVSNVEKAKMFVSSLHDDMSTNIHGALLRAIEVAHLCKGLHKAGKIPGVRPEPMVIFLTDGQPNVGESDPDRITSLVTAANGDVGAALFSLAFGDDADMGFLKKLSLRNAGFARKIYEAADAALQLGQFYRLVASPLLANVRFQYQDGEVVSGSVTSTNFRSLFGGSELVVAGRLSSDALSGEMLSDSCGVQRSSCICKPTVLPKQECEYMERLWAFLTIKQLLDHVAADTDVAVNKKQALELALKYSFVTPLTSLVVVKPDEIKEETSTETGAVGTAHGGGVFGFNKKKMKAQWNPVSFATQCAPTTGQMSTSGFFGASPLSAREPFGTRPQSRMLLAAPCSFGVTPETSAKMMAPRLFGGGGPHLFSSGSNQTMEPAIFSSSAVPPAVQGSKTAGDIACDDASPGMEKCKVSSLHVKSNIWCRYASTTMKQVFVNHGNTKEEINFNIYLTLSAVISHCTIFVDGKGKRLRLLSKKAGELHFTDSKKNDTASVLVRPGTSDGQRGVTVCVVLPPQATLTFKFQYEEFLEDFGDGYLFTFNLNPGQTVPDLQITVNVEGFYKLAEVRALRIIPYSPKEEVLDQVEVQFSPTDDHKAMLRWSPSAEEQGRLFGADDTVQLGVEYKAQAPDFGSDGPDGEVVLDESGQTIHVHLPGAAGPAAEARPRHLVLLLHVGTTASGEMRELVIASARNLLLKLHERDLFSILICSNDMQVWEDSGSVVSGMTTLGTEVFPASQENIRKARDFITQTLAIVPSKDPSMEAALTKALQLSGQTEQARPKIFVLSTGGTSAPDAGTHVLASGLKSVNAHKAAIFSLSCGSAALSALFREISADSSGFACELHKQTVERLLDLFFRMSDFDRIDCKVVHQNPVFDGFMEKFWLKEAIEQSKDDDMKITLSLKHNIATSETSFFAASE
ncbi:uncharacterized protein LOC134540990 isoform X2 [Bacillus rossius redtenbacheri]|uniref:uncharacterized protein LOC134540990 isoform X2 n=1 Tax=Bacillus rossius redtenbacheri TaxID=93214 RepID=UPI002FDCFFE9